MSLVAIESSSLFLHNLNIFNNVREHFDTVTLTNMLLPIGHDKEK